MPESMHNNQTVGTCRLFLVWDLWRLLWIRVKKVISVPIRGCNWEHCHTLTAFGFVSTCGSTVLFPYLA